ncbi:hypothetical protein BaRGS_00023079, partial [Batillaria attramentaria]
MFRSCGFQVGWNQFATSRNRSDGQQQKAALLQSLSVSFVHHQNDDWFMSRALCAGGFSIASR